MSPPVWNVTHLPGIDMLDLARPERFELPTSWFVAMTDTPVYARPARYYFAFQGVSRG